MVCIVRLTMFLRKSCSHYWPFERGIYIGHWWIPFHNGSVMLSIDVFLDVSWTVELAMIRDTTTFLWTYCDGRSNVVVYVYCLFCLLLMDVYIWIYKWYLMISSGNEIFIWLYITPDKPTDTMHIISCAIQWNIDSGNLSKMLYDAFET